MRALFVIALIATLAVTAFAAPAQEYQDIMRSISDIRKSLSVSGIRARLPSAHLHAFKALNKNASMPVNSTNATTSCVELANQAISMNCAQVFEFSGSLNDTAAAAKVSAACTSNCSALSATIMSRTMCLNDNSGRMGTVSVGAFLRGIAYFHPAMCDMSTGSACAMQYRFVDTNDDEKECTDLNVTACPTSRCEVETKAGVQRCNVKGGLATSCSACVRNVTMAATKIVFGVAPTPRSKSIIQLHDAQCLQVEGERCLDIIPYRFEDEGLAKDGPDFSSIGDYCSNSQFINQNLCLRQFTARVASLQRVMAADQYLACENDHDHDGDSHDHDECTEHYHEAAQEFLKVEALSKNMCTKSSSNMYCLSIGAGTPSQGVQCGSLIARQSKTQYPDCNATCDAAIKAEVDSWGCCLAFYAQQNSPRTNPPLPTRPPTLAPTTMAPPTTTVAPTNATTTPAPTNATTAAPTNATTTAAPTNVTTAAPTNATTTAAPTNATTAAPTNATTAAPTNATTTVAPTNATTAAPTNATNATTVAATNATTTVAATNATTTVAATNATTTVAATNATTTVAATNATTTVAATNATTTVAATNATTTVAATNATTTVAATNATTTVAATNATTTVAATNATTTVAATNATTTVAATNATTTVAATNATTTVAATNATTTVAATNATTTAAPTNATTAAPTNATTTAAPTNATTAAPTNATTTAAPTNATTAAPTNATTTAAPTNATTTPAPPTPAPTLAPGDANTFFAISACPSVADIRQRVNQTAQCTRPRGSTVIKKQLALKIRWSTLASNPAVKAELSSRLRDDVAANLGVTADDFASYDLVENTGVQAAARVRRLLQSNSGTAFVFELRASSNAVTDQLSAQFDNSVANSGLELSAATNYLTETNVIPAGQTLSGLVDAAASTPSPIQPPPVTPAPISAGSVAVVNALLLVAAAVLALLF